MFTKFSENEIKEFLLSVMEEVLIAKNKAKNNIEALQYRQRFEYFSQIFDTYSLLESIKKGEKTK